MNIDIENDYKTTNKHFQLINNKQSDAINNLQLMFIRFKASSVDY